MRSLRFSINNAFDMCGRISYYHGTKRSSMTAYEIDEAALIQILLPRKLGVVSVCINIYNESFSERIYRTECTWNGLEEGFDSYLVELDTKALGVGLYFFRFEMETQYGTLYSSASGGEIAFTRHSDAPSFQLSVSDFKYRKCNSKLGGIIYHIFVDNSHGCNATIKTLSDYISNDLETNKSDLKEIVQILKKSKCDVSIKNENSEGNSCCHIIAKILEEYLPKNTPKSKRVLNSPF